MTRTSAYAMIVSSLVLLVLNLAVIAPMATSAVQDVVDEMTVMTEEDWSDDSWLNSTDERSYYAWTIANIDDVKNGSEPQFERVGPYTFQIDSERNIIAHDATNGILTYDEISTFTSIGENSPTDLISNINILFEAQKIVVFPTLIEQLQQISQAGFVVGMLEYDLTYTHASIRIAADLQDDYDSTGLDSATGSAAVGNSIIVNWAAANNYSGPDANFTDLTTAFEGVIAPGTTDEDLSLLSKHGSEYFLGFGSPSQTNSSTRAAVYGYADGDPEISEARDSAMHWYVQNAWTGYGGGISWESTSDEDLQDRMGAVIGTSFAGKNVRALLTHNDSTNNPDGLLAWDSNHLIPGFANFFSLADNPAALGAWAFLNFGISLSEISEIGVYAGDWMDGETTFPLVLSGGQGAINSFEFVPLAWGGMNPVTGEYDLTSVNGPSSRMPWLGYENVNFDAATIERILNGPMGLTTDASINLLYGIYSGKTVPVDADYNPVIGGQQLEWSNQTMAAIYNITTSEADTLEYWVKGMFDGILPDFLESIFGVTKYSTMEVNQWLFGWHDPLLAYSASNETSISAGMADTSVGWASLETNKTYYSSPNVTNEPGIHAINTGEIDLSKVGEYVANDGNPQLWWRTSEHYNGSYGLSPIIDASGTTGGWVDGTNYDPNNPPSFTVNLADYAILEAQYSGKGDLHGITTEVWRIDASPVDHPVQAKNLDSETIMDVFPGVLPIYFGTNVTLMTESVTGRIVSGESESVIYYDQRGLGADDPTIDDLQAVFMIVSSNAMDAETAQLLQDKVHANQDPMMYWANFDTDGSAFYIDQITAIFYALAIIFGGLGGWKLVVLQPEDKSWLDQTDGEGDGSEGDGQSSGDELEEVVDSAMAEEE
ncbi:MAG TPA: hypothetical protein EYN46_03670 [Candidatus Poseidoniales archaeon]|nr:hypothetical protein [Candidatus Poseidoniales archaeon]